MDEVSSLLLIKQGGQLFMPPIHASFGDSSDLALRQINGRERAMWND